MRLTVLLGLGVIELQRLKAGAGHEQECDVLNLLDVFLVHVLDENIVSRCFENEYAHMSYLEDLENIRFADHYCMYKTNAVRNWVAVDLEFHSQNSATVSARHSSIDEDTSPRTESGV